MTTHAAIAELSEFSDFSDAQVRALVDSALAISQVRWILGDEDVNAFFRHIVEDFPDALDPQQRLELQEALDEQ